MRDDQADEMIRLLVEIRDGQRLQMERQAQIREELLAQQQQRLTSASKLVLDSRDLHSRADDLIGRSARVVASFRVIGIIAAVVVVVPPLAFFIWRVLANGIH